jgi:hypothetical protein
MLSDIFLAASEKPQFPKYTCSFTLNPKESVSNDDRFEEYYLK